MNRRDWLLLTIAAGGGDGLDPVQLQKGLFLLGARGRQYVGHGFYRFVPHNYGPFSKEIYEDAEQLAAEGLITKERRSRRPWSAFTITDAGRDRANLIAQGSDKGAQFLASTVNWVKTLSFNDLVQTIYKLYPQYRANSVFRGQPSPSMTLVVGILCSDGVVMAADGAATYAVMSQQTIRQPMKKLYILPKDIIAGVSGPIGTAQRYCAEIPRMQIKGNDQPDQVMQKIRAAILPIVKDELTMAQVAAPVVGNANASLTALASAMVAITVQGEPCLFQFNWQGSPEAASKDLPFIAIGSAQATADPFLAFIRRLFWPDKLPTAPEGVFAAVWTVRHAIQTSPGGVAEPIQVAVLKGGKARELEQAELEECERAIDAAEKRCTNAVPSAAADAPAPDVAPPPQAP